jgi:hypothetical protein
MKKWKDLKQGDLIFRLNTGRNNDIIIDCTSHKLLTIEMYSKNYFIATFEDDIKEHHSDEWDGETKYLHFEIQNLENNRTTQENFNDIEFYSDKEFLLDRIKKMKEKCEKEIEKINDILSKI